MPEHRSSSGRDVKPVLGGADDRREYQEHACEDDEDDKCCEQHRAPPEKVHHPIWAKVIIHHNPSIVNSFVTMG